VPEQIRGVSAKPLTLAADAVKGTLTLAVAKQTGLFNQPVVAEDDGTMHTHRVKVAAVPSDEQPRDSIGGGRCSPFAVHPVVQN
jgi:hypothetical protein